MDGCDPEYQISKVEIEQLNKSYKNLVNFERHRIDTTLQREIANVKNQLNSVERKLKFFDVVLVKEFCQVFQNVEINTALDSIQISKNDVTNDCDSMFNVMIQQRQTLKQDEKNALIRLEESQKKLALLSSVSGDSLLKAEIEKWIEKELRTSILFDSEVAYQGKYDSKLAAMESNLPNHVIPSESEMIDAVAILIANRFKEEAALTFFNVFQRNIKADSLLTVLFPRTIIVLSSIENFTLPSVGPTWKASFAEDLLKIPTNLKNYLCPQGNCEGKKSFFLDTSHGNLVMNLVSLLEQTKKGTNFFDVVSIALDTRGIDKSSAGYQMLLLLDYFNTNLIDYTSNESYFVSYQSYKKLNPVAREFYIQKVTNELTKNGLPAAPMLSERFPYLIEAYGRLEREIIFLNEQNIINGLSHLTRYWSAISDIIHEVTIIYPENDELARVNRITRHIIEIQKSLEAKNFGNIPLVVNDLLRELVLEKSVWNVNGRLGSYVSEVIEMNVGNRCIDSLRVQFTSYFNTLSDNLDPEMCKGFIGNKKADFEKKIGEINVLLENRPQAHKYAELQTKRSLDHVLNTLSFISDILTIDESKELSEVIMSKAAPVSAYKIKRYTRFAIDLNSYPGFYAGSEWIVADELVNHSIILGFTVPVGISFSWGGRCVVKDIEHFTDKYTFQKEDGTYRNLTGHSHSIVASVFDLSAPVAFRLRNGNEQALPQEVTFAQFWAPGVYYAWGIKETPFALLVGAQLNPQLRSFSESQTQDPTFSVKVAFTFDVPLYNLKKITKIERKYVEL